MDLESLILWYDNDKKDIRKIYYWEWYCSFLGVFGKTDGKIGKIYAQTRNGYILSLQR